MKKIYKFVGLILATIIYCSYAVACSPQVVEKVDSTKSQLYIANYSGGAGTQWLDEVKTRFEEKYATVSFQEDKMGVQLMIEQDKSYEWNGIKNIIKTDKNQIYFSQAVDYYNAASEGMFYDLTELINDVNVEDNNKTIKSKFYDYQLENLAVNGKYYVLPHYELYQGVSYDAGVFKSKKLYFADEIDQDDTTYPGTRKFVLNDATKKSCGPDGKYGTYDDGLPSSFHEFYKMMDKMTKNNVIPFVWAGKSVHYTQQLVCTLYANYARANGININFIFDSLGKEFEYVERFNGDVPVIKKDVITKDNAYLTKQSAGLYYAMELAEKVFTNEKNYYIDCIAETFSHLNAMEEFMYSGLEGSNDKYIAMLIDGSYWYNEANEDDLFTRVEKDYPLTYKDKDVKFMPLPVQYSGTVTADEEKGGTGHAPTMIDAYNSYAFINANIKSDVVDLAKTFLAFCYTDAEMQKYTLNTGIFKALKYDVSTENLSSFAQSVIEMKTASEKSGELVRGYSNNPVFVKNMSSLHMMSHSDFWANEENSTAYRAFVNNLSLKDAFTGMWISETDWNNVYLK